MLGRLRVRAARLIRQLDAGVGYRDQIERSCRSGSATGVESPRRKRSDP
jgi:hypothetical protein